MPLQLLHILLKYRIQHTSCVSGYQPYCAILQDYYERFNSSVHLLYWINAFILIGTQTVNSTTYFIRSSLGWCWIRWGITRLCSHRLALNLFRAKEPNSLTFSSIYHIGYDSCTKPCIETLLAWMNQNQLAADCEFLPFVTLRLFILIPNYTFIDSRTVSHRI